MKRKGFSAPTTFAAICTPAQIAAYDVRNWVTNLNSQFPSYAATVNCTTVAGAPISCNINLSWSEKYVAVNQSTAASAATASAIRQNFTLYVEP